MARTPSNMLPLHTPAADFALPEPLTGQIVQRTDFLGQPLLVAFICNHCPFVIHIQTRLAQLARDFQQRGVAVIAINANDTVQYPADAPDKMIAFAQANAFTFPYLFDESQSVARAYDAACTPDFYVFDRAHRLYYRGQFDDARPGNELPVTGADLSHAVDCLLAGQPAPELQKPSLGCNIKWRDEASIAG